jgi:hypothetical protein
MAAALLRQFVELGRELFLFLDGGDERIGAAFAQQVFSRSRRRTKRSTKSASLAMVSRKPEISSAMIRSG